jgi:hypothetical protein
MVAVASLVLALGVVSGVEVAPAPVGVLLRAGIAPGSWCGRYGALRHSLCRQPDLARSLSPSAFWPLSLLGAVLVAVYLAVLAISIMHRATGAPGSAGRFGISQAVQRIFLVVWTAGPKREERSVMYPAAWPDVFVFVFPPSRTRRTIHAPGGELVVASG